MEQRPLASFSFWWRAATLVAGFFGMLLGPREFAYFTVQTNILTMIYLGVTLWWMLHHRTLDAPAPRVRGAVVVALTITMLVSHVMLNNWANPIPPMFQSDPAAALDAQSIFLVHYVVPVMMLVDWVVGRPHGTIRASDLWRIGIFPVAYGLLMIARGALFPVVNDRYPYPFLDPSENGWGWVVGQLATLVVIVVVISTLVWLLDRWSAKLTKRR